jgi:hypothetical protein
LQGHGHTADIDRPLRFELLADDIAGLLDHLGLPAADLFGYSSRSSRGPPMPGCVTAPPGSSR